MRTNLSWLTTIPSSTTQEHAPGAPDGAEDLRLVTALETSGGLDYRRTPLGDAVAELTARAADAEASHQRTLARLAALSPVLTAATKIMGVQALDPANEEDGAAFAAKLLARVQKGRDAEARLAALLTPAEGVDVEEVLRLDREATPGPWHRRGDHDTGFAVLASVVVEAPDGLFSPPPHEVCSGPGFSSYRHGAPWPRNANLTTTYRTAAPALAREVIRARSMATDYQALAAHREGEVDQWRARVATLEQELGRLQSALGGEIEARRTAEDGEKRLMQEAEEMRLTLAAEQGKPEGAPSSRWVWRNQRWEAIETGRVVAYVRDGGALHVRTFADGFTSWPRTDHGNARAAMLAADAAVKP